VIQPALLRFEPRTPLEAAEAIREAGAMGHRLALHGGGTHAPPRADVPGAVISTLGLCEIVEYAAQDQTVTVEAGITLAELDRRLAQNGQRLVVEVAQPERATVGGAIAANAYGPRRMRYGSLKDLILGVTLARADGTTARAGGKVVKNVAGFDLSKLLVGSYGTLALVTTATLRVHPLPEKTRAVRASGMTAEATWAFVLAMRARQLEPAAVVATLRADETDARSGGRAYSIDVLFEGFAAGVDAQVAALLQLALASGMRAQEFDWEVAARADRLVRSGGPLRVRCTARPSDFRQTDRDVIAPVIETLEAAVTSVYPALGVAFVCGAPRDAALTHAALLRARADLERNGGSLIIEALPQAGMATLDTWGTPPPSFALMRQLKARFDPQARLNPGCFVGGL
jgi:glycolate oxidase FAD binding subunit